ncbi:SusC/RagA family TonB-linked outer membrane protein [Pedobacter cryoconitis]|uniref:SusC/RagA family TonB-linked outer membrane protein n=1 Tax=Pedobacter cryoconitis TaxID=188932 RepID=UPI001609CF32|nr:SusC/RagA family TonB-linked outer membrane protein [Pedobacter cryoconitis]MBB5645784.1 TonB-linked SusC/RagA family outer membrane protein [Pedobacter cryoconitis]
MKKLTIYIVMATLCLNFSSIAQVTTLNLKGKIIDENGVPVPGINLSVMDTKIHTITNKDGIFDLLNVQAGSNLKISGIGYITKQLPNIQNWDLKIIVIQTDNTSLKEVEIVSTGYQNIPKERATGSFAQPIKVAFESRVSPDVLSKLNGITSGLVFNANTGNTTNGQFDINIRGRSTIKANDQPLIIVDNFPYSGDINNINPNDVASITILKDASASSVWGVKAGNGVIVITTKKGLPNSKLRISLNANITIANKPDLFYNPNFLSSNDYIGIEKFLFDQGKYTSALSDNVNYPSVSPAVEIMANNGSLSSADSLSAINHLKNIDVRDQNQKYFYRKAISQQYALNLSGGTDKVTYYVSAGMDKALQMLKNNENQRITLSTLNVFRPVKNLEISTGLYYTQSLFKTDNTLMSILGQQATNFPYNQYADLNNNPLSITRDLRTSFINSAQSKGFLNWSYFPLNELGLSQNNTRGTDTRISTSIKYELFKGLNIDLKYQYQKTITDKKTIYTKDSYYARNLINQFSVLANDKVVDYNVPIGGFLNYSNGNTAAQNFRAQLNYSRTYGQHDFTILAGYELSQASTEIKGGSVYGYDDDVATYGLVNYNTYYNVNPTGGANIPDGTVIGGTLERLKSAYAIGSYNFQNKYTLTGSTRIDGSNYFGVSTNQKSVPLWSVGGKWKLSDENFYKLNWFPQLYLTASYGYNGNLDRSTTGITTFYRLSNARFTRINYADVSNIGNPNLRWERNSQAKFGIDFSTLNNTISGSVEYFFKKGVDLIGSTKLAPSTGVINFNGNFAEMSGNGVDITLNSRNLKGRFGWLTSLLVSYATDKVTKYDLTASNNQLVNADGLNGRSIVPIVGKPVYSVFSLPWGGLDPQNGDPIGYVNGVKSKDYATINSTGLSGLVYNGPARPTLFGGLSNTFTYADFALTLNISFKFNYFFRRPSVNYTDLYQNAIIGNIDYHKRWQKPGDELITNTPSAVYPINSARDDFYSNSSVLVEKADHIRLQDVSISYTLKKSKFPFLPVSDVQLYAYVNNVGILWRANKSNIDPDFIPSATTASIFPNLRSFAFGLKVNF